MKEFSVYGVSNSGKTTTVQRIISELKKRGYSVGSVKEIGCGNFHLSDDIKDTHIHKLAGSELITARSKDETFIHIQHELTTEQILSLYDCDYVVLEGVSDIRVPKIITASDTNDIELKIDHNTFLISGVISHELHQYNGLPVIDATQNIKEVVDIIEKRAPKIRLDISSNTDQENPQSIEKISKITKTKTDNDPTQVRITVDGQEFYSKNEQIFNLNRHIDRIIDKTKTQNFKSIDIHIKTTDQ